MSGETTKQHSFIPELTEQLRQGKLARREFLRTATLLGMSASAAYATAGIVLPSAAYATSTIRKGGTFKFSMQCQEMSDPAIFNWTEKSNVARHVLEYLTYTGADNITRPYLCENWNASEDLKTWTLHLRKGVSWNNGDAFGADDVVHNFARWLDSGTGSSNQGLFSAMVTETDTGKMDKNGKPVISKAMTQGAVEKIDAHTVRLHLNRSELAMPENLYNYPCAIVHRDFDDWGKDFLKTPVGTGAFELKDYGVGEKAVLTKRDPNAYWGDEVYLDQILYIDHGDDAAAGLAALASKQVDAVYETFVEQIDVIKRIPGVKLYESATAQGAVARMQVDAKPFTDKRVRQAVQACIDHERILQLAYRGRGTVGEDHHISPIHPEYAELPPQKQDYAKAKRLLAEAGFADGIDLEIACKKEPPWELAAVQTIVEMCKPAGINIKINLMPNPQFWDIWDKADFGFTAWAHRPLGVMTLNLAYRSGVPWNESHYANPEFDRILDLASATLDADARRVHMAKLEKILQDDAVFVQPLWRSVFSAAYENVFGYELHPTLNHQFNKVWLG